MGVSELFTQRKKLGIDRPNIQVALCDASESKSRRQCQMCNLAGAACFEKKRRVACCCTPANVIRVANGVVA